MNREVLTRPFTPAQIKTRPGPGGKHFRYLETSSVIERLNETGDPWSFEVIKYELLEDEVIVTGKLTLDGVAKMDIGSASITRDTAGVEISVGDDVKAGVSDCIKRCARLFGCGLHLYSTEPAHAALPARGGPESIDRITQRQLQAIHAHARRRGIALPELGAMLLERTGKDAPQSLTRREASGVLDVLSSANGTHR